MCVKGEAAVDHIGEEDMQGDEEQDNDGEDLPADGCLCSYTPRMRVD